MKRNTRKTECWKACPYLGVIISLSLVEIAFILQQIHFIVLF